MAVFVGPICFKKPSKLKTISENAPKFSKIHENLQEPSVFTGIAWLSA